MKRIRIGTRGSKLALTQTRIFTEKLKKSFPELIPEIKVIKTKGDIDKKSPLYKREEFGFFTREIEKQLLERNIDLAVHSLKDMPTEINEELLLVAVLERENPSDVLISDSFKSFTDLPPGAKIGTGSLRRKAQLLHMREDLNIVDIRGNLDTRIKKLKTLNLDGIIAAYAGLKRLKMEHLITEVIPPDIILPAASQGAIGIQVNKEDEKLIEISKKINHTESYISTMTERSFLKRLNAGCSAPVGIYCKISGNTINCLSFISSIDGKKYVRESLTGSIEEYESLGYILADKLLSKGGAEILKELRRGKN